MLIAGSCADNRGDGEGFLGGELGTVPSCPRDEPVCPDAGAVTYGSNLQPILDAKCVGCHGPGGQAASKSLATYADLLTDDGGRQRGRTAASFVLDCKMPPPPLPPLSDAERATLYCWLAGGEKE